jgi:hypothetical protein
VPPLRAGRGYESLARSLHSSFYARASLGVGPAFLIFFCTAYPLETY